MYASDLERADSEHVAHTVNVSLLSPYTKLRNFPQIRSTNSRVMVTSVLADRHPGELHIFRNYDPPSLARAPPYASTATFQPLTIPQGSREGGRECTRV